MRLIRAYGADPHRFCAHVWPGRAVWSRDIDQGCDAAIFRVLTTKTATHPPRVLCTTLRGYPGYTKAYGRAVRQPPWVLHGGWGTWQRQQPWLQYCPHCLQEDADPYFRRRWRLAFVTICPAHRQQLLDRCAVCSAVVNFHASPPMRWLSRSAITVRVICAWPTRPRWHPVLPLGVCSGSKRVSSWRCNAGGAILQATDQSGRRTSRRCTGSVGSCSQCNAPPCTDRRCPQSYNTCFSPRVFLRLPGKRLKDSLWWTACGSCSWWPRGLPSGRHRSCSSWAEAPRG